MIDFKKKGKSKFYTSNSAFYEMYSEDHGAKVMVQAPKSELPNIDELVDLKNDFEFSNKINSQYVLKSLKLERSPGGIFLLKEHFDGIQLNKYFSLKEITVPVFFQLGIRLAKILEQLHKKQILLKNFCPENILISPESLEFKVCSLGLATSVVKEQIELQTNENLSGSLWHIAPEQTGRIGRSVDFRSDYYSLGVIFYEMLCGRLPFNYSVPMELIHAHIAKKPIEPHKLNPGIPEQLSHLIMKMLEKNAEDRYQSALGIIEDLEECSRQLQRKGKIDLFPLGQNDVSAIFSISEKLYGRANELDTLLDAFSRVQTGPSELILVSGYSGIGKTRLINEIHRPIVERNGFFSSGKFDQYNRDTPFSAIGQAFNSLSRQLLAEDQDKIDFWKNEILKSLDGNGQVLIDIIPEMKSLIGKQEPILKLGLVESKNRFFNCFIQFLSVLDMESRPFVIFLDDLQWADSGSLELIRALLNSPLSNLLLVGAYRDNEVTPSHPLVMAISNIQEQHPGKIHAITLTALQDEQVNLFLADSLRQNPTNTMDLSEVIISKTGGNPFFIKQFLQQIVDEKLIYFDNTVQAWMWKISEIREMSVTENVVDLVIGKIQKLSDLGKETLSLAACVGNRFDIETLAIISQKLESILAEIIWETIREGFVNPMGKWQRFYKDDIWESLDLQKDKQNFHMFKFQHDKIQQAAYSLIPDESRKGVHLRIGKLLIEKLSEKELDDTLFEVLTHLNADTDQIKNPHERQYFAELNLKAGEKAKNSNAIQPALKYYSAGLELIREAKEKDIYKELLIGKSECEYLLGNYDKSESLFDEALTGARKNLEKADILSRKMALYENTQRHEKALDAAKKGLKLLGTNLPLKAGPLHVMWELIKVKLLLLNKSVDKLKTNKRMDSPEKILTMNILMNLWGPVYLLQKQNLLAFKILRMVNLSIRHGNSIESALAYSFYGYVLSAQMNDYKNGYAFAKLGKEINEIFSDKSLRSKVIVISDGCVFHWRKPFASVLDDLKSAYTVGVETNDIIYAGYALSFINRAQVLMGETLPAVYNKQQGYLHFIKQIQSAISLHQMLPWVRLVSQLLGKACDPDIFGECREEEAHYSLVENMATQDNISLPLANYCIAVGALKYFLGEYEKSLELALKAKPNLKSVPGLPEFGEHYFYLALSILAMANRDQKYLNIHSKDLKKSIKLLTKWSKNSPENYLAKYLLVQAEYKSIGVGDKAVGRLYEKALNAARNANNLYMAGLINERRSEYYMRLERSDPAKSSLSEAILDYKEWGAKAKVDQLLGKNQMIQQRMKSGELSSGDQLMKKPTARKISSSSMDLQSILKASISISGEVAFEKLLEKLLLVLIENAGAQNACIILVKNKKLNVEAFSGIENEFSCEIIDEPLEKCERVSRSIIQLAYNSKDTVLVNDSAHDNRFGTDAYIKKYNPRSVLCMPILQHGNCVALAYLENNISSQAFTPERVEILHLLSGQIAISIENSQLVENLEQKVQERTYTIEQQKVLIEEEKQKSDDLLLNILPSEVADELKEKGAYTAKSYDMVSIMFTDFSGFTNITEQMKPEDLVEMIDICYREFDRITAHFKIEKIKTIGDSYMCVSGLPHLNDNHAQNAVNAAMEMLAFIKKFNLDRQKKKLPSCPIRIGIHSGPVVAGVVGSHKFAFDIWGDAVNIASRMEASGQEGKINISEATYRLVGDHFKCTPRGLMEAKNKGKIGMYFVEN